MVICALDCLIPISDPKSTHILYAGFLASGNSSARMMVPTRSSTDSNSDQVIVLFIVFYTIKSLTTTCTLTFPFHSLRSISITSETIFPTPRWGFLSAAFQRRSLSSGFSDIDMDRCFSSCPRGLVLAIVTFSMIQSGRGLPMPYGRNRSMCSRVAMEIADTGRMHSTLRIFFGRSAILCARDIALYMASRNSGIRSVSMVNPAA